MLAKSVDLVKRFNTQPPEGGWPEKKAAAIGV